MSKEDLLKQIDVHGLSKCKLSKLYIESFIKDYGVKSSINSGGKLIKNTSPKTVKQSRYNPNNY